MNENDRLDDLLTPKEVAKRLRVAVATLAIWRCTKRYPLDYHLVGRKVMYRRGDVEEFLRSNLQKGSISPRER
jgi:hypothetical protein